MPIRVTDEDILSIRADAAVVALEMTMHVAEGPCCTALAARGGQELEGAVRSLHFISVGRAAEISVPSLPYAHTIATAVPRWLTGKANEMLMLRRCYESVFDLALSLGCRSVVTPFLSSMYYRFPPAEAVRIARETAESRPLEITFVAETEELFRQGRTQYRRPRIVSYVGYYRDHAIFELDNGLYARVDIRPEIRDVTLTPYFEACFRTGNDPNRPPLPETEIERLRLVYENSTW